MLKLTKAVDTMTHLLRQIEKLAVEEARLEYGVCECGDVKDPIYFVPEDHVPIRASCLGSEPLK